MTHTGSATSHLLGEPARVVAPRLLGSTVSTCVDGRTVAIRLTEVEAYEGGIDPGSHGYRGRTARNSALFGPPGTLYVYFTYGMHHCANIVCGTDGSASAVLMRAGEVVAGVDTAVARRGRAGAPGPQLASGPARLAQALGLTLEHTGLPVDHGTAGVHGPGTVALDGVADRAPRHSTGPRTGVSGPGGGEEYPWRFWLEGERSVSRYRPAAVRRRESGSPRRRD
ncbi:DNA-3-methyladenine glycosylase [Zhihengliuella alba]|uniref:Putative 3-methyladenine DNA glycosylase n=1 Tax=Zhihengliuella alba TaxID=547018 RepID=A0ABP7D885_9MICC